MNGSSKATLTQCPHCDTVFQVSDEQLRVAQGRAIFYWSTVVHVIR